MLQSKLTQWHKYSYERITKRKVVGARKKQQLDDPFWVLRIADHDEPPLFSRLWEIEFLEKAPINERGPIVLEVMLILMQRIVDCVNTAKLPNGQRIEYHITFSDFNEWRKNELVIPIPAISLHPHVEKSPSVHNCPRFIAPKSDDTKEVEKWLHKLDSSYAKDFCVGELDIDPDLQRVYVGLKGSPTNQLMSFGDDIQR